MMGLMMTILGGVFIYVSSKHEKPRFTKFECVFATITLISFMLNLFKGNNLTVFGLMLCLIAEGILYIRSIGNKDENKF